MARRFFVGTAGWTVPKALAHLFAESGTVLERYASRFNAVEINSSFYRPHQRKTYERWAASAPAGFHFAVKAPRQITHELRLVGAQALLDPFLDQVGGLGPRLGPILFQLPPSLAFDDKVAAGFFAAWRARFDGPTVCEPRHASWFSASADRRLTDARIARAAVDPSICAAAAKPGGSDEVLYFRLHGSPVIYQSPYGADRLRSLVLPPVEASGSQPVWCILDNTMFGAAAEDGLALTGLLADEAGFGGDSCLPILSP